MATKINQPVNTLGNALVNDIVRKVETIGFNGLRGARLRGLVADLLGDLWQQRDHDAYGRVYRAYETAISQVRVC